MHADLNIVWVCGFSSGKAALINSLPIRKDEHVIIVEFPKVEFMPWIRAENLEIVLNCFKSRQPDSLNQPECYKDLSLGLSRAVELSKNSLIVVCGSLYLVRDFLNRFGFD